MTGSMKLWGSMTSKPAKRSVMANTPFDPKSLKLDSQNIEQESFDKTGSVGTEPICNRAAQSQRFERSDRGFMVFLSLVVTGSSRVPDTKD